MRTKPEHEEELYEREFTRGPTRPHEAYEISKSRDF